VKVWDAQTGKLAKDLFAGEGQHVAFSPNGQWLATSGTGVQLWRAGSWHDGHRFEMRAGCAAVFSPDRTMLAFETGSGVVRLVEPQTGREWARLEEPMIRERLEL
jgi:hypothetical protein